LSNLNFFRHSLIIFNRISAGRAIGK
jgi:hypothetical protein